MITHKIKLPTCSEEGMSLERQSQTNSVLRILKDSIAKLRICLVLPKIFENFISARQRSNGSKYLCCLNLIEDYIKEKNSQNIDSVNILPHLNHRLIEIFDFFHVNILVLEHFNDWSDDIGQLDKSLVDSFRLLLITTEKNLKKSASSEVNKEKQVHELYQENAKAKGNLKGLQSILKCKEVRFKWKQAAQDVLIRKYEKDLTKCKYENNIKIKREIVQSSHNIRQIHADSVTRQNDLKEELERVQMSFECLLKGNLKQEKSARDERNQLLFQLEALVRKYDQTMGDKIKECMDLQSEYENQKELFDSFLIQYYGEKSEYERIVRAREEEEKHHHEQKILLFMMNRSAQVIQKHWRKFRRAQKKSAKRNKGRGKSKKK